MGNHMNDNIESQSDTATDIVDTSTDSVAESDSLAAGFAKVRGDKPHTDSVTEPTTTASTDSDDAAPEPESAEEQGNTQAPVEQQPAPAPQYISADDFKRYQEKVELDQQRMFGKFGEFQKKINGLTQQAPGQTVKFTKESLKKLSAEFPEFAELLADDLGEILKSPASGIDQTAVDTLVSERIKEETTRIELASERKLMFVQHRDWESVVKSDEFAAWKNTLPPEVNQALSATRDSMFLGDAITEFKKARDAAASATTQAEASKDRRAKKLEASVVPSGMPAARPAKLPDEVGLSKGFSKVRSQRSI